MSSNGDGFGQFSDTIAALDALIALNLTTLPDADIARLLQTAETARRKLDGSAIDSSAKSRTAASTTP